MRWISATLLRRNIRNWRSPAGRVERGQWIVDGLDQLPLDVLQRGCGRPSSPHARSGSPQ
jgi:hypothetical protein